MALRIEDYGLIGDTRSAGLVGKNGAIDWLALHRFDSDACFAALLGNDANGTWEIRPSTLRSSKRRYRGDTMILETDLAGPGGEVRLIDFMPYHPSISDESLHEVVRIVEGLEGEVEVDFRLSLRPCFGLSKPIVEPCAGGFRLTAGPDGFRLRAPVPLKLEDNDLKGRFKVRAGERVAFSIGWYPSHRPMPDVVDPEILLAATEAEWRVWAKRMKYRGFAEEGVRRSLLTLRALTYSPTGGIVAAPTTSLPEDLGGFRNWDYRFCWLRDASLTLDALMIGGFVDEAIRWRDWLLRAVADDPANLQIMYGIACERRLPEMEVPWLSGYENSRPVRIGNAASDQFQLDVYGEVISCIYGARLAGAPGDPRAIEPGLRLMKFLEEAWKRPDDGIWEMRGGRRHNVHSKLMAWVAFDRMVRLVERFAPKDAPQLAAELAEGALDRWRRIRDEIHAEICEKGFNSTIGAFTQSYGTEALDAAVLLMGHFGFLPPSDPRLQGTIRAIERELVRDGFVRRYATEKSQDGLPGDEGTFLPCSFWLADNYALAGRLNDAEEWFDRLDGLKNDLGLFAEEFDPRYDRMVGNFPQAFTHIGHVLTAAFIDGARKGREQARGTTPRYEEQYTAG